MIKIFEFLLWLAVAAGSTYEQMFSKNFSAQMLSSAPEIWQKLNDPANGKPSQLIREYIWKREYLNLDDPKLRKTAGRIRLMKILAIVSLYAVAECYMISYFLSHK